MSERREQRRTITKHLNPKLRRSLRLLLAISVVLIGFVIYDIIRDHASIWQVGLGLLAGMGVGLISARIYKISWNDESQHAASNIDIYGVIVLVLYVAFDLSRNHIVHLFTSSQSVPAITLALLAGAMYGRVFGTGRKIMQVLREQQVLTWRHSEKHRDRKPPSSIAKQAKSVNN
ncbi:hypothetical protein HJC99_00550 [Candidatus Saccharibacteria bacterium]|nr:hypothetical protein [Candidatus Saccharibacteria bacterium]